MNTNEKINNLLEVSKKLTYARAKNSAIGSAFASLCDKFEIDNNTQTEVYNSKHKNDILAMLISNTTVNPENINNFNKVVTETTENNKIDLEGIESQ